MPFSELNIPLLDMQETTSAIDFPRFVNVDGYQTASVQAESHVTWVNLVIGIKWSNDGLTAHDFDTPLTLTSTSDGETDIDVSSVKYLVLTTNTSPAAEESVNINIKLAGGV